LLVSLAARDELRLIRGVFKVKTLNRNDRRLINAQAEFPFQA